MGPQRVRPDWAGIIGARLMRPFRGEAMQYTSYPFQLSTVSQKGERDITPRMPSWGRKWKQSAGERKAQGRGEK